MKKYVLFAGKYVIIIYALGRLKKQINKQIK